MWPVIIRELRAEARRPFNYWLRVLSAVGFTVLASVTCWQHNGPVPPDVLGHVLFSRLNGLLFLAIGLLVPALTADCISGERREGTLGLLFLTPLNAPGIAIGKSLIHGLRALTLLLAVLPMLALPLVLGGIELYDIVSAAAFDLSAVALGLAAGLIATAWSREWVRALMLAEALSLLLLATFTLLIHVTFVNKVAPLAAPPTAPAGPAMVPLTSSDGRTVWARMMPVITPNGQTVWMVAPMPVMSSPGPMMPTTTPSGQTVWVRAARPFMNYPGPNAPGGGNTDTFLGRMGRTLILCTGPWSGWLSNLSAAGVRRWYQLLATAGIGSLVILFISVMLAALQVKRSWQDEPPSQRQLRFKAQLCSPILWRTLFRRRMSQTLDHNPIAWLQQYSWNARLTKWGWCLGLIGCEILLGNQIVRFDSQVWLCWMLAGGMAFAAASSFSREKQSGALELILVTPITVNQLIRGRVVGVWRQFLPSLILLALVWTGISFFVPTWDQTWRTREVCGIAAGLLTIPVIGLYFALRMRQVVAAWLVTCAISASLLWLTEWLWPWRYRQPIYVTSAYILDDNFIDIVTELGIGEAIPILLDWLVSSGPTLLSLVSPVCMGLFFFHLLQQDLLHRRFALVRS